MRIAVFSDRSLFNPGNAPCPRLDGFCRELGKSHEVFLFTRVRGQKPAGVKELIRLPILPIQSERNFWHKVLQVPHLVTAYRYPKYSRAIRSQINSILTEFDFSLVFDIIYAQYLPKIPIGPTVVDLVDAPSRVARGFANMSKTWKQKVSYLVESLRLRSFEKALVNYPIVVISQIDAEALSHLGKKVSVIPNGIYKTALRKDPNSRPNESSIKIGFLGVMNYPPNEDAAIFFAKSVFPKDLNRSDSTK